MKQKTIFGIVLVLMLALIAGTAGAKGMASMIEIEIPGFYRPIQVEDKDLLEDLSMAQFAYLGDEINPPRDLGSGLMLTRYLETETGMVPFDRVAYFVDLAGGPGYVFYLGLVNGTSEYDGRWFLASESGAAALNQVLEDEHIYVNGLTQNLPQPASELPAWALLAVGLLAGGGLGWGLGRRNEAQG